MQNGEQSAIKNFIELPITKLVKADWNYKVDNEELKEKLKNNIKRNGQIENIIVRELETGFKLLKINRKLKYAKNIYGMRKKIQNGRRERID